ncbi:glycosyltransferase [Zhouia spongiae]|uniref:Glycosyltransferase n=1 Tax=Zhouia spongiae TaxID=2202721 RepID=A0ABY3YJV9_9FLAO|nr:glycosyltransferase [Zhouia spongiae]UNY97885.1 glycosyltransferase [Zhouia spongiae]
MKLSVVMPVYNGSEYLKEAMDSILNQSFSDFEFIIINDGSTDNTLQIIESYNDDRIFVIDQENKGLAVSLNIGLQYAKGKYIARMDADDIAHPDRFKQQLNFLKNNTDVKLLGTAVTVIDRFGNQVCTDIPYTGNKFLKKYMNNVGNPFKHPTVVFDRKLAISLGGYNECIGKYFEDYFLWSQIARKGKVEIMEERLLQYRITPGSIMSSIKSNTFSKFMVQVVQRGFFTNDDAREMRKIKTLDDQELNINNKVNIYNRRISQTKNRRIVKIYKFISSILNEKIALKFLILMMKFKINLTYINKGQ